MSIYLIVYSAGTTGSIDTLNTYLESYSDWARLFNNTWIVKTIKSLSEVRSEVRNYLPSTSKIIVIDITESGWATYNFTENITNWMKKNI